MAQCDGVEQEIILAAISGSVDRLQELLRCSKCKGAGVPIPGRSCFRAVFTLRSTPGPCHSCSGSGVAAVAVDTASNHGHTALFIAARSGFALCVAKLLAAQACPNKRSWNWEKNTPLIRAAAGGHGNCVSLLLEAGAAVNVWNKHGHTALLLAAQAGHKECVEMLVDAGAVIEAKGDEGHTALIRAAQAGHFDCVDVLRNAGAHANMRGDDGVNATSWAERRGHVQIAQMLAGRVLTVHISAHVAADGSVTVAVTDIQGEELASVAVDSAQFFERARALLDGELSGQSYTLMLPSGHVLTAEDDARTIARLCEEGLQEDAYSDGMI